MELHQLRYVVAIANTGNFTRASEVSFVSQPSLSQQVAKLEKELGHKLFHRLGRRAVPTDAGAVFIERARRILVEVENATSEIRDDPQLGRQITLGAIQTVAPYILPSLIMRTREVLPNLQINTYEGFRGDLVEGLVDGRIDLALVAMPLNDSRLSTESIFREPLLLAVGRNHRLATKRTFTVADLADETFIMMGRSSTLTEQVNEFCGEYDFEPKIGFRCGQVSTLKSLVGLGLGIAILPRLVQSPADHNTIIYRHLTDRMPTREIGIVRHLQRYQSRGMGQFLELIRQIFHGFGDA
ncbi:LysR family transcriptional regulator [Actomonas aquatica]|uniref:LysR family transcriptional regulator n=1 Tax=Actomonas aquatica TaxID=2866162 RepID=A0ABZ1CEK7_9BACT|nr:LysR family transcriptional regulator [Opitutus sp. WL0086]WRQ89881.1 LysR family transcriptional regulator [Opitutus sp. WL0086]